MKSETKKAINVLIDVQLLRTYTLLVTLIRLIKLFLHLSTQGTGLNHLSAGGKEWERRPSSSIIQLSYYNKCNAHFCFSGYSPSILDRTSRKLVGLRRGIL